LQLPITGQYTFKFTAFYTIAGQFRMNWPAIFFAFLYKCHNREFLKKNLFYFEEKYAIICHFN
jgi:hypothetical protein